MAYRVLSSGDAFWRPSNQMKVENTDLAQQLEATTLGARFWRLHPGQASTKHRHFEMHELYVLIEGTGRMRIDEELVTLEPHSAVLVEPEHVRQLFNDSGEDALWLVVGAPREGVTSTLEMSDQQLAFMYPDGPRTLPPELGGGEFTAGSDGQSS
jgi:mannose-6-phosphate isomerase-like protein (cupin superfamily)